MDIKLTVRNKEGPDASVQTAAITFNLNKIRGNNIPETLLVYDINLFNLITSKIHKSQTLDRAHIGLFSEHSAKIQIILTYTERNKIQVLEKSIFNMMWSKWQHVWR